MKIAVKLSRTIIPLLLSSVFSISARAQQIEVKDTVMTTYGFSNPDPVPTQSVIYPYWRFTQFTTSPQQKSWTMVVLENKYLRVKIFPEIGGKIWAIFDKTSGQEMFYDNNVVKFRDIALRGPWTSGGIEFNYGVVGHAPTCSNPVNWKTATKEDGSVSCYIGVCDMLSRSHWTVEINLPKDAVWVRTSSIWHNGSGEYQPYYTWANSGVKTGDDVKMIYPAQSAIGHGGEYLDYPLNEKAEDISYYRNQAYGHSKSYHMVGSHKGFFGVYYESEDRGVLHYALRDEKLGRKFFSWAQSEEGSIWTDLLSDSGIPYVEMQSGRLFNQNRIPSSYNSSYRQFLFTPFGTDRWSDYWLPFNGIGVADNVNLTAVTSVRKEGSGTVVGIYPLRAIEGKLCISDKNGKVLKEQEVSLQPAQTLNLDVQGNAGSVSVAGKLLWSSDNENTERPRTRNLEFNNDSQEGRLLLARDNFGMRKYADAEKLIDEVLTKDAANVDALCLKAQLLYKHARYNEAYEYSNKALSIDQYNPEAGYIGGLAALALSKTVDALDRLEIAAIANSDLRSACYTELSSIHFKKNDLDLASEYARKALSCNADNLSALGILCKIGCMNASTIAEKDPLSHFPAAEQYLRGDITAKQLYDDFREELPWEEYLELAIFYNKLGLDAQAVQILEALPSQNILTALWTAWLKKDTQAIAKAEKESLDFVFAFRRETYAVLNWATGNNGSWKSEYLLAMLLDSFGRKDEALEHLKSEDTGYAPYFCYRYSLTNDTADLRKAYGLAPDSWLYRWHLATDLTAKGHADEAISILQPYCKAHPDIIQTSDALMDAYVAEGRYEDANKIADSIVYLPFEGQSASHKKYRDIKLKLAEKAINKRQYDKADKFVDQALLWPTRLGVGKPYDEFVNTSLEDSVRQEIDRRRKSKGPFETFEIRLDK